LEIFSNTSGSKNQVYIVQNGISLKSYLPWIVSLLDESVFESAKKNNEKINTQDRPRDEDFKETNFKQDRNIIPISEIYLTFFPV